MDLLLWKWKQAWAVKYENLREESGTAQFNVNGDDLNGDLWDWEIFAEENYRDTLPQYPAMVCLAIALLPLMFR